MPGKNVTINTYTGGLVKDLHESSTSDKLLVHARNAMMRTKDGDAAFYTNEPSNLSCITTPYKYNGSVQLKDNRLLIFSSDNTNSEIGIGSTIDCKYYKLINNSCLSFNNSNLITGIVSENEDGEEEVIFNDGINPTRILNLNDIPYTYTIGSDNCKTKTYTSELSCEDLRLFSKLTTPCLNIYKGSNGSLKDGSYQVVIAYTIDDIKYSDYYALQAPIHINNEEGQSSLTVELDNLDRRFDQFQLIVIGCIDGVSTPKIIGSYSTIQNKVVISDFDNPEYLVISNQELVVTKVNYEKAGIISSNSQYALLADLTTKKKFNVQQFTSQVELEYVIHRCPLDYYKTDGQNYSYWRNENYNFFLRYIYTDGEFTDRGQIVGPTAKPDDLNLVTGCDRYENTIKGCNPDEPVYKWQAYNTASNPVIINNSYDNNCCIEVGYGDLGFYQSTELYPDNKEIYGELACTPIRLHKFPDECKVPRYVTDNGKKYIQILGVRAKNIPYPKDDKGKDIEGVVGYEILRSDRDNGNKTVLAAGLVSNVRGYKDKEIGEVMYSNYPYNDLSKDSYLSSTQVTKNNGEKNYNPLDKVYQDRFNFYTPHGEFFEKYRMGTEFRFHTEECADVTGYFEKVYKHPRHKLLTNSAFYFAALLGIIEAYLTMNGKKCVTLTPKDKTLPSPAGPIPNPDLTTGLYEKTIQDCDTAYQLASGGSAGLNPINSGNTNPDELANDVQEIAERTVVKILQVVASVPAFLMLSAQYADNVLKIIRNFSKPRDYVYQYVSHADFNSSVCVKENNKRRGALSQPLYLDPHLQTIDGETFNNYQKQKSIYLRLNCNVDKPSCVDNSRKTIKDFGVCADPSKRVTSKASMYYVTSQQKNPNQYGPIDNLKVVKVSSCVQPLFKTGEEISKTFFGGDCVIYSYSVNTKQPLFTQNMGDTDFPDETAYDYRLYNNIGYPRYWADFTEYDMGDIMNIFGNKPNPANITLAAMPAQKFNLDCNNSSSPFIVNDEYMYTSVNGVIDFVVEADYNIAFRRTFQETDGEIHQPHYSAKQSNLSYIFREDRRKKPEGFYLKPCYKNLTANQIVSSQIKEINTATRNKNSVIYSLPSYNTNKYNNWRYFLPANFYNFDIGEFGNLTNIHAIDQDRLLFLFTKSSPYISLGVDELQTTDGTKITIGDGGLFARRPRELMHTDTAYGSSHDPYAFISTKFGHFYPSSHQGKFFNFNGSNIEEISRKGLLHWAADYGKILLKKDFPEYDLSLNTLNNVGYSVVYDDEFETVYFCKRDYCLKKEFKGLVTYNKEKQIFKYQDQIIKVTDSKFFDDASVTISYYASGDNGGSFVSFHDWHPDATIQQENHFITVKGNTLYKHNERYDHYCNFYGVDYPHELEIIENQGLTAHTLASVEYIQDVEIFNTEEPELSQGKMLKYPGFDEAIIYNKYQNSGILSLTYDNNQRNLSLKYPKKLSQIKREIPYSKDMEYFRFNMFDDKTKDLNTTTPMWKISCNGYIKELNPEYLDLNKSSKNTAKFNHTSHNIFLRRNICNNMRMITRAINSKIINPTHI